MIRTSGILLASAAASLSAAVASASTAPDASQLPIVVVSDQNADRVRAEFVKAMALPSAYDQLGRFEDPVCPKVYGLKEPYNAIMVDRMRRVASAAGIDLAGQPCRPNAYLFVVRNKAQLMGNLRRSHSTIFGDPDESAAAKALAGSGKDSPSYAWQVLQYRTSTGELAYRERLRSTSRDNVLRVRAIASRIYSPLRAEFGASVMVIEAGAIGGADLRQVADFAAMQLLAKTEPQLASEQKAPTILTLLDDARTGRPAPLTVTQWDLGYLRALYGSSNMYRAGAQHGELARLMKKSMEAETAAPER